MTVTEVRLLMAELEANGKGAYPVQIQAVEQGVTYADDIDCAEAQDYDGERVWIWATERHSPDWFPSTE